MNTDVSPIHPQLQSIAKKSPRLALSNRTVWLINLLMSLLPAPQVPGDTLIKNVFIRDQDHPTPIRLRVYQPETRPAPRPVLVWLHGGGYVIGKPEMDDRSCAELVRALGIAVVSVDYRCAPQHPFPAGLDDGYTALKWVAGQSQQLGLDAKRIALGGASAAGGLAAALAQLAHDRQEIELVFQMLVYPMLDDRTVLRAEVDDRHNVTWTQANNRFGWEAYLGRKCGSADVPAYAVPARRADLSGLPPAWIGVGSLDIFHDEDVAYGQRLAQAGVKCEIDIIPGAFHGFDVFDPHLPLVQDFRQAQIAALKKCLAL